MTVTERSGLAARVLRAAETNQRMTEGDLRAILLALDTSAGETKEKRCSGCGHRWSVPEGFILNGAELCGDCWRKAQPVLHGTASAVETPQAECEWREDEDGVWFTACDGAYQFTDGTPAENKHRFCVYCGKPIKALAYMEPIIDD